MTALDNLTRILMTLVPLSIPIVVAWSGHRLLLDSVDDRGLFSIEPFRSLPALAGALLAAMAFAANGWLPAFSPWSLFEPSGPWHADLATLRASLLDPRRVLGFWNDAARHVLAAPNAYRTALALLAAMLALIAFFAACAWRRAWAVVVVGSFTLASVAMAFIWHNLLCMLYWTLHWLNFWIFGVLILLVQWRRKEGPSTAYQSS